MKRLISFFLPPGQWYFTVVLLLGIFFGLGAFSVYLSKAQSYLGDDPATCVNCHIMAPQYATWSHSAHRNYATCNDCHVPHNNVFNKYFFKAKDGMRHATLFTLRAESQVIQIKDAGKWAVQSNCVRCHEKLFSDATTSSVNPMIEEVRKGRFCWDCHRNTPHGRVNGLSSTPNARIPLPQSPVPDWLKKMVKQEKKNQ